jgi:hypothetical protein
MGQLDCHPNLLNKRCVQSLVRVMEVVDVATVVVGLERGDRR